MVSEVKNLNFKNLSWITVIQSNFSTMPLPLKHWSIKV